MRALHTIIPFLFCACAPNINSSSVDNVDDERELTEEETSSEEVSQEDSTEEDPQEDIEDPTEEEPSTPEDEPTEDEPSGDASDLMLVSGVWSVAQANLVDDPCDWNTQLSMFFGIGSDGLLPKDFTVAGFEGSFEIELKVQFCCTTGISNSVITT